MVLGLLMVTAVACAAVPVLKQISNRFKDTGRDPLSMARKLVASWARKREKDRACIKSSPHLAGRANASLLRSARKAQHQCSLAPASMVPTHVCQLHV